MEPQGEDPQVRRVHRPRPFSNFTYFLENPLRGDQFSQTDHRTILGGNVSHVQAVEALGASHTLTAGVQSRADIINGLGLYHTQSRQRFATVRQDDVRETSTGVYLKAESRWTDRFRSTVDFTATTHVARPSPSTPPMATPCRA